LYWYKVGPNVPICKARRILVPSPLRMEKGPKGPPTQGEPAGLRALCRTLGRRGNAKKGKTNFLLEGCHPL